MPLAAYRQTRLKVRLPIHDKNFSHLVCFIFCTPITRKPAKSFYIYLHYRYNFSRISRCRVSINTPLVRTIVRNSYQSLAIACVCCISLRSRCVQFTRLCALLLSTISAHPGPCLNTRVHHCAVAVIVQMRDCVYTINSPR